MRRLKSAVLFLLIALAFPVALVRGALAADAVTCANCHNAEGVSQPVSPMGRALQRRGANSTLESHPKLTYQSGPYTYSVETHEGKTEYKVTDGSQTLTLPVQWAMGAHAQTWILERDGQLLESLVSFYPSLRGTASSGLDITTGDEPIHPKTIEEALGRPIGPEEAKSCFGCHSTNAVIDRKLSLSTLQPGVTCEHCHTGTAAHLATIVQGDLSKVPPKLGTLSSEDMLNFCGQCHRTWETVVRSHWKGTTNVRFQPYRLANSKCFDGSDSRISCVACHNPHENVVRTPAYYDAKCLACHAPLLKPVAMEAGSSISNTKEAGHGKVCPVAKANCTTCHMPKVALPNGHLRFTDHQIRVVREGEPFPN